MSSSGSEEEEEEGVGVVDGRFLDPRSSRRDLLTLWLSVAGEKVSREGEGVEETGRG